MSIRRLFGQGLGKIKEVVKKQIGYDENYPEKPEDDSEITARMEQVREMFGKFQKAAHGETPSGVQTEAPAQPRKENKKSKDEEIRDKILSGTGVIEGEDWLQIKDIDCEMDIFLGVDKSRFPNEEFRKFVMQKLLKECQNKHTVPKRKVEFLQYLLAHEFNILENVIFNMRGLSNDFAMQWLKAGGDYALYYENKDRAKDGLPALESITDDRSSFYVVLREAKTDIRGVGMKSFEGLQLEFLDELIARNKAHMIAAVPNAIEYFDKNIRDEVVEKYLQYCLASISSPEIARVKKYAAGLPGGLISREVDIFSINDFPKITPYLGKVSEELPAKFRGAGAIKFADALEKAYISYQKKHSQ
ncbi:MAG: hypothetical protein IT440_16105 [Phycisphaeraceae bacterium]|nr:hypothetical protein [Phycisphaeraceae bacterium]